MSEIRTADASERVVTTNTALSALPRDSALASAPATTGRRRPGRRDLRARDHDDVLAVYRAHHRDLVRFAGFVAPEPAMAEDLVHEAFVKLYGAWRRIDDPSKVAGYLRTTVLNLARGRARHLGVVRRNRPDPRPDAASAEAGALRNDTRDRVVAALRHLSDRQRACLVLRHYEDRTESEIAEILGISIGSVRTHVHRGMEALGRLLAGDEEEGQAQEQIREQEDPR